MNATADARAIPDQGRHDGHKPSWVVDTVSGRIVCAGCRPKAGEETGLKREVPVHN